MILLPLKKIIDLSNAEVYLPNNLSLPNSVNQVAIDTRQITDTALFVALSGANFNGHDFSQEAQDKGAVIALVEEKQPVSIPQLIVRSCLETLSSLAEASRRAFTGKVLAITGSNGKTSTKEMLVSVLKQQPKVSATQGNQNNELGLPLTLLNISSDSDYAVVEMGARYQGDISALVGMALPHISVVTNIGFAHIGCFGSREAIAQAKSEIYSGLSKEGHAVFNLDDEFFHYLKKQCQQVKNQTAFSTKDPSADVFCYNLSTNWQGTSFTIHYQNKVEEVVLSDPGIHHVSNALCVAACSIALGIEDLTTIAKGLSNFEPPKGRSKALEGFWRGVLIDDSYNANPGSVKAAIDLLALYEERKILVLGDMLELGDDALTLHKEVICYAKERGINRIFLFGPLLSSVANDFNDEVECFNSKERLLLRLKQVLQEKDVVLLKGSRSIAMDTLINPLLREAV